MLKSTILVKTRKGNKYLYDRRLKKTILCHPLLHFLLNLEAEENIEEWIGQIREGSVTIDGYGVCSKRELEYYYKKYLILKANGHFESIAQDKRLSAGLTPDEIKKSLANTRQITLEITQCCGLHCDYCGYGKFYSDYDKRTDKDMDISSAIQLLNFLQKLWNSPLNSSHDKNIYLSFYGGEPLLHFSFIKELITYAKQLKLLHNRMSFAITTNGILLRKYMDFLVAHNFNVLISLDGNEKSNGYRVFKNRKPAFQMIMKNIRALQTKYPDYFKNKVNFNAVLHNKNSVSEIFSFFKQEFDKIPRISALSTSGIKETQKAAFRKIYSNITESLYNSEDYSAIEKEMFIKLPNVQDISLFVLKGNDSSFDNYNQVLSPTKDHVRFPTGTCLPFSKKVFVTVNGKILPCERIGQQFFLGHVNHQSVTINYKAIAEKYNAWLDKLRKQCSVCYNADYCRQCVFHLNLQEENPACNGFMTYNDYSRKLSSYLDFIEDKPGIYQEIFNKVLID